jgi:predicted Mrr-cat superfamily restriction endonuclease
MKRFWAIAPYEHRDYDVWEAVWRWNLKNGHITLGWGIDRDPSNLTKQQLVRAVQKLLPERTSGSHQSIARMIWYFYHDIHKGDIILARRGIREIAGFGTVTRTAYYDPRKSRKMPAENQFENFINVRWHDSPRDLKFEKSVFGVPTLQPIPDSKVETLLGATGDSSSQDEEEDAQAFPEGKEMYRLHRSRERNREVVQRAKSRRCAGDPSLHCDVCGFSFVENYGKLGSGYVEAHHCIPISKAKRTVYTRAKDFALVCSNCHRMLHRRRPWLHLQQLRSVLLRKKIA